MVFFLFAGNAVAVNHLLNLIAPFAFATSPSLFFTPNRIASIAPKSQKSKVGYKRKSQGTELWTIQNKTKTKSMYTPAQVDFCPEQVRMR
jgi:hypothetical protein